MNFDKFILGFVNDAILSNKNTREIDALWTFIPEEAANICLADGSLINVTLKIK